MQESTITAKGQTTLPRDIRAALGVTPGDRVRYIVLDGGEVRILAARPVMDLAGQLAGPGPARTLEEIDAASRPANDPE